MTVIASAVRDSLANCRRTGESLGNEPVTDFNPQLHKMLKSIQPAR
ncbi:MAG: hypothetical protein IID30_02800 [Planctomycetes bacterium]|nr:hypothetical protein [Planctomycetota bacterium]